MEEHGYYPTGPGGGKPKKGKGCLFYGCMSVIVVLVLIAIGAYVLFGRLTDAVLVYTEDRPREIAMVSLEPEEIQDVRDRISAFEDALDQGVASELILDSDEINAFIHEEEELKALRGRVHVKIEGSEIGGEVSFPLSNVPIAKLKDRYVNGSAKFNVSLEDGELLVQLKEFEVKGESPPEQILSQIGSENLVKEAELSPETKAAIKKLESIEISDGKLIVRSGSR